MFFAKLRDSRNSWVCQVLTGNHVLFNNLTTKHDREMGLSSLDSVKKALFFHTMYLAKLSISKKNPPFLHFCNISAMAYCIKVLLILAYLGDHSTCLGTFSNGKLMFQKISIRITFLAISQEWLIISKCC